MKGDYKFTIQLSATLLVHMPTLGHPRGLSSSVYVPVCLRNIITTSLKYDVIGDADCHGNISYELVR